MFEYLKYWWKCQPMTGLLIKKGNRVMSEKSSQLHQPLTLYQKERCIVLMWCLCAVKWLLIMYSVQSKLSSCLQYVWHHQLDPWLLHHHIIFPEMMPCHPCCCSTVVVLFQLVILLETFHKIKHNRTASWEFNSLLIQHTLETKQSSEQPNHSHL